MTIRRARIADFIIGGTEKAGTTSVFDWLSAHPQVAAASRKETDFFRELYCGERTADLQRYAEFFTHCDSSRPVFMEASTGYLGEAAKVAPRIATLVPDARILFILRDPVERLYSSYQFHRGRLDLPADLTFADYVRRCLAYEREQRSPAELGLDEWYLKVLRFGRYAEWLSIYRRELPAARIEVMFFEALRRDPGAFMRELSGFLGIDAEFWNVFDFQPSNVTFAGRNQALHRLAVQINRRSEVVLRRVPRLKRSAVRLYKVLNQSSERQESMPAEVRSLLADYYAPSIDALRRQMRGRPLEAWAQPALGTEAA